jgi:hypothetical protein
MEADKVRKKLHGSILKGNKIRVEDAKPEKRKADDEPVLEEQKGNKRKTKKSKREDGVIGGFELPDGRKVKRGWTDPESHAAKKSKDKKEKKEKKTKDTRKQEKSKFTKEPELLFKTILPPNVAADQDSKSSKKKDKPISTKKDREVVVHEFEKTKKQASFLRSTRSASKTQVVTEFVDGKGWVDEDGKVIEQVNTRTTRQSKSANEATPEHEMKRKEKKKKENTTSVSEELKQSERKRKGKQKSIESTKDTPSPSETVEQADTATKDESPSQVAAPDTNPKTPHPLETIYKRSRNRPTFIDTTFSFFGDGDEGELDGSQDEARQSGSGDDREKTPFSRGARSGAPTPDTAAAFRRFSFSRGVVDEQEEQSDADELEHLSPVVEGVEDADKEANQLDGDDEGADEGGGAKEESVFAKWFWENRGENNRTWKRMRREAMKEKRKRENRRIGRKIV